MIAPGTARPRGFEKSNARAPFGALEILHDLAATRSLQLRVAARSKRVWIGAAVVGALVCWRIVANHFALSRHTDEYVSLLVNQIASHNSVINHAIYIASEATLVTGGLLMGLVWYCSHNSVINHAIYIASEATLVTGGLLMGLVWYCWFNNNAEPARERLLLGFGAVMVAALLSRLLQLSLPMRARPLHDLSSGFLPLPGIDAGLANHWGSFPSDHAALFFALVAVIWRQSRWLGVVALLSAIYGVVPRIYFGLHYLSDVLAGAALGVALVLMFEHFGPRALAHRGVGWEQRLPAMFYGAAFLLSLEVATLFEDIRQAGRGIPAVLKQFGI